MRETPEAHRRVDGSMDQCSIRAGDGAARSVVWWHVVILSAFSAVAVVLTFCPSALAQSTTPAKLTALQKEFNFDGQLEKVTVQTQAAIQALHKPYLEALGTLQAKLQKAGNLNGFEAVAQEVGRFKAERKLTEEQISTTLPELQTLQRQYCTDIALVTVTNHLKVFALRAQYANALARLQKELTTENKIEDARTVRAEFVRVAALPEVAAARPVAKGEFEKEYAKYQELLARNAKPTLAGKAALDKAWQAICLRWNVADAGRTPGTLTWNDADGTVQTNAVPPIPPPPPPAGQPWTNSLGMEFVSVRGTDVLFCKWETREQDYAAFAKDAGLAWQPSPESNARNPMVGVNWTNAQAFCKWLTEKEHKKGALAANRIYRLPMDWEWSVAVGLKEDRKGAPEEKNGKIADVYPWGNRQLPPTNAGNYDPSLKSDSWPGLAPVGSFAANTYGIFDLGGNVWEWCEDFYNGKEGARLLRGGSFGYFTNPKFLLSSYRFAADPARTRGDMGFRCVVTKPSR